MEEELRKYGLNEKEIKIYLSCLKLGSASATQIFEHTGIRRSTVYEVLEALKKKGLVKSFIKEKKYHFDAVKPSVLIDLLKEKQEAISKIMPNLNKLVEGVYDKPKIEVYEGKIGIRNATNEMLNAKEILIYGASQEGDRIFDSFPENFARKRVEKKIFLRAIVETNPPEHMLDKKIRKFTEIRNLKIFDNHEVAYFIYNNILLIFSLGEELVAIRIESPIIANSQRIIFESLWKIAKK